MKTFNLITAFALLISLAGAASAHRLRPIIASVEFHTDATFSIEISGNLEVLLSGISPAHGNTRDAPQAQQYDELRRLSPLNLERRLKKFAPKLIAGLKPKFDDRAAALKITHYRIPEVGDLSLARISSIDLSGTVPAAARTFTWALDPEFGSNVLKIRMPGAAAAVSSWLENGARSAPLTLHETIVPKTTPQIVGQYLGLGYEHIVPLGVDHILFVLGLFFLSRKLKPLLWQVTAFTLAHSLTLGLAIYGVFTLPPTIVEPLIAASIAYVGIENILTRELKPWRVFLVFGFGLLHGMGFAGVLMEIGLPRAEYLTGLIAFNVGVEFGQLTVVGLAFVLTAAFAGGMHYRRRIVIPASAFISAVGLYWTVQRIAFGP